MEYTEYGKLSITIDDLSKLSNDEVLKQFKQELENELVLRNITLTLRELIELAKGNKLNFIKLQKFRLNKGLKETKDQYDEIINILSMNGIVIAEKSQYPAIEKDLYKKVIEEKGETECLGNYKSIERCLGCSLGKVCQEKTVNKFNESEGEKE